jgi:hypothetical protein
MKSTPAESNEQRPDKEPSKLPSSNIPIDRELNQTSRQYRPDDDGGYHPFPNLRGCKNMRYISMSGELEEPRIVRPVPQYCRVEKPPIGSEVDLVARLVRPFIYVICLLQLLTDCLQKREREGCALPMRHKKRRHEDSQLDIARTSKVPRQQRRCEPEAPVPTQKKGPKLRARRQRDGSLKRPTSSTPIEWGFSRFCPSISSLAERFFKFF